MGFAMIRFDIPFPGKHEIELPVDSKIMSFGIVDETPCGWALGNTDPKRPTDQINLVVLADGEEIPSDLGQVAFLGTISNLQGEPGAVHVFAQIHQRQVLTSEEVAKILAAGGTARSSAPRPS